MVDHDLTSRSVDAEAIDDVVDHRGVLLDDVGSCSMTVNLFLSHLFFRLFRSDNFEDCLST